MRSTLLLTAMGCFLLLTNVPGIAQPGTPDQTFGKKGKVLTSIGTGNDYSRATVIQADGKIVIAGNSEDSTGLNDFSLVRYTSFGQLDTTFGRSGRVRTDIKGGDDYAYALAVQADGKILVAGKTGTQHAFDDDFVVVRYNSDGSIDKTFGKRGKAVTDLGKDDAAYSIALQSDGKIIVAGTTNDGTGTNGDFAMIRYDTDGTLDPTFGSGGITFTDLGSTNDVGKSIMVLGDDRILFTGTKNYGSGLADFALLRYTSNGVLDNGFDGDGVVTTDFSGTADVAGAIAVQSDGKIVVAGTYDANGTPDIGLARYNSDGSLDNSFVGGGLQHADVSGTHFSTGANAVGVSSEGKIIVLATDSRDRMVIVRYNADGSVDTTFGQNGASLFATRNATMTAGSLAIQADNKIILTGSSLKATATYSKMVTARMNYDILLPITLSYFTASKKENAVLLNWATSTEENNDYFAVERSGDNSTFTEIGKVGSRGNSNLLQLYSFEDVSPLTGGNYYRLKQVDKDGHFTYSKTAYVGFGKIAVLKLYPNPAKNYVTIEGLNASVTTIFSVINVQGQVVAKATATGSTYTLNIQQLAVGTYYLRIEADNKAMMLKFVKQ